MANDIKLVSTRKRQRKCNHQRERTEWQSAARKAGWRRRCYKCGVHSR